MQSKWCLQFVTGDVMVTVSICKDPESGDDDKKGYYPQLWLFEQVS